MPTYYSPAGNAEVWTEKPDGYLTVEEWIASLPIPPDPTDEQKYNSERNDITRKYSDSWNGISGGILTLLQMTIVSALAAGTDTTTLYTQYNNELTAMNSEFEAIDEKYGVA